MFSRLSNWSSVVTQTSFFVLYVGARCSTVVEHPLMVRLVVGSTPHSGPIELFLVPTLI